MNTKKSAEIINDIPLKINKKISHQELILIFPPFDFYHSSISSPSFAIKTLLEIGEIKHNTHNIDMLQEE